MQRSAWLLPIALVLGCATTSPTPAQTTEVPTPEEQTTPAGKTVLRGTVTGVGERPLELAHVRLTSSARGSDGKPTTVEVEVGSDGTFSLEGEGDGYHEFEVTAVDHAQHTFGVLLDGKTHDLSLQLGTYRRPVPGAKLTARGHFKGEHKGKPITFELTKTDSGRYLATVERPEAKPAKPGADPADNEPAEFRYQVTDLTSVGRTVNGTSADHFEYDGGGDYWAVLPAPAPGEKLEIEFDPKAIPKAGAQTEVTFGDPASVLARVATLSSEFAATDEALNDEVRAKIASFTPAKKGQEIDPPAIFAKLRTSESESIAGRLESEEDPIVRRILLVRWAGLIHVPARDEEDADPEPEPAPEAELSGPSAVLATAVLEEVSAIDPLWSLSPGGIHSVVMAAGQGHPPDAQKQLHAYEDEAIAEHPDVNIGASLLLSRLSRAAKTRDMVAARVAKEGLQSDRFKGTRSAKMMIWFDPERPLAAGNKVPAFEVASLDGKSTFKPSDFEGKILVLDFWATWCGPCKADMPVMHAAYAKANGKKTRKDKKYRSIKSPRVEFLSISFDAAAVDAKKYHAAEWPMPWNHAFVSPDDAGKIREELGIMGIPTLVVVDTDGTIIASTPNMNGGKLDAALTELLAKRKNGKTGRKPEEIAKR